jgi:carbon-monoxide dehydrogenase large subunit
MGKYGTGQAIRRIEDGRFLTGRGRYTGDITLPGQLYLHVFRAPYCHARVLSLDVREARAADGVRAVYTAADIAAAGIRDIPGAGLPGGVTTQGRDPVRQQVLARDVVRYTGEPVAAVIADSPAQARDAAELIFLDAEELPAAVDPVQALQPGVATIHDAHPGNLYGTVDYGNAEQTRAAFAHAATVVETEIVNNRLAPTALEPRGCNAVFDGGTLTLYQGCQGVHTLRDRLAATIDLPADDVHVISPDVGGGFGLKYFLQCEPVLAAHATRDLGKPVKWIADRNESFLADTHGRDHVSHASLALDSDGRILAMKAAVTANIGAYCSQAGPTIPWFGASMTTGCYDIPTVHVEIHNVLTNTVPVEAYRGAGRPEAAYLVERLMDKAAASLGLSPPEFRRRNFIRPDQFPYTTPTGRVYDSGEYERLMDRAMARAEWDTFDTRRVRSEAAGKLRGIGLCYYVEVCSGLGHEAARVRVEKNGRITALVGTQASGQGHETTFGQMLSDVLGVPLSLIDIVQGDSKETPYGYGTVGSRSMAIGGSSLVLSAERVVEAGRAMAAEVLEAAVADIEYNGGSFRIAGTDRVASLAEVAAASYDEGIRPDDVLPGLESSEKFTPEAGTFPNGCHVCELELDPQTGSVDIVRYTIEDDVGTVINPLILEGQIAGGVAQGLGQACGEHAIYDRDTGQLVTATFMDYPMPRADWIPDVDFHYTEVPSPRNPIGAKGAGEAGTVGAAPAYINALINALSVRGIDHIDMPATPHRIWQLLNG